jgi:membrane associated rhomboid family serine protease
MWLVEALDGLALGDRLQAHGIGPRRIDGLEGVLLAPLLHSTWGHLASNTVSLAVLGWLAGLRGRRFWVAVTAWVWLAGGGLVWLLAGGSNHIGASGLVFGYFGALMGAAVRSRRPASLAPALVAIFLYGTMLVGLVPQDDLSWEGHLAGLAVGFVVARRLTDPPPPPPPDDEIEYPWEIDEPWRIDEE